MRETAVMTEADQIIQDILLTSLRADFERPIVEFRPRSSQFRIKFTKNLRKIKMGKSRNTFGRLVSKGLLLRDRSPDKDEVMVNMQKIKSISLNIDESGFCESIYLTHRPNTARIGGIIIPLK